MTDFLNAEDIMKAVGAFTGEQRAPLRTPLPASSTLAPAPRASRGRPVFLSASVPTHPAGRWWSVERGPRHFPNSARAGLGTGNGRGGRAPCRTTETLGRQRPGGHAARTRVPDQGRREGWKAASLGPVGARGFLCKALGGDYRCACFSPRDRFPDRPLSWLPECLSPFSGAQSSAPRNGSARERGDLPVAGAPLCSALREASSALATSSLLRHGGRGAGSLMSLSCPGLERLAAYLPSPSCHPDGETEAGRGLETCPRLPGRAAEELARGSPPDLVPCDATPPHLVSEVDRAAFLPSSPGREQ